MNLVATRDACAVAASVFALACSSDATVPTTEPAAAAAATHGPFVAATTFKTTCGPCHGENGEGNGPVAASLTPRPANFHDVAFWIGKDKAYIAKVIKEGGAAVGKSPLMVAWGGLFNDEQTGALADVVMGFKP